MSGGFDHRKRVYDAVMAAAILTYIAIFIGLNVVIHPNATAETILIRALSTCAFLMLHVVLSIGPLCRLDARFLPLLYNRRHLGVTTFFIALGHAVFALIQFHALGVLNPIRSLFISNPRYDSLAQFPFESLGFGALVILFVMAATSHDFWLVRLGAARWKALHMLVYIAYALVVAHVALGVLQAERNPILIALTAAGFVWILGLHLAASSKEPASACRAEEIEEGRAKIVFAHGERVAIFKHRGELHALANVCAHQGGPLGEGRIIDGCVTCPWHGYQYLPETGISPPPFPERVAKYDVDVIDGKVFVR